MRNLTIAVGAALAALAFTAPGAYAQKPVPCAGMAAEDAAGDQELHVPQTDVGTTVPAEALTDMTGIFLRTDGNTVTANIVISELSKTVPDGAEGVRWTFYFTTGEQGRYLRAILDADGTVEYLYGNDGTTLEELGSTKGAFHEGANGVITMVIPAAIGGKPGTQFTAANAIAAYVTAAAGLGSSADFLPDGEEFETTVPACAATTGPGGPNTGTGPGTGPGTGGTNPPPAAELRVTAKPTSLRARKIKPRRPFAFTLTSSEPLTDVTVSLRRGKRAVASGRLARLEGSAKVKLKARKRLGKGTHSLVVSGRRSDGSIGTATIKVRVR